MKCMTYGVMPERGEFDFAFAAFCPEGTYHISHGSPGPDWRPAAHNYTREELWVELEELVDLENSGEVETADMIEGREDSPGSWASDILYTLGFEWV